MAALAENLTSQSSSSLVILSHVLELDGVPHKVLSTSAYSWPESWSSSALRFAFPYYWSKRFVSTYKPLDTDWNCTQSFLGCLLLKLDLPHRERAMSWCPISSRCLCQMCETHTPFPIIFSVVHFYTVASKSFLRMLLEFMMKTKNVNSKRANLDFNILLCMLLMYILSPLLF